jgi:hypothetical protein
VPVRLQLMRPLSYSHWRTPRTTLHCTCSLANGSKTPPYTHPTSYVDTTSRRAETDAIAGNDAPHKDCADGVVYIDPASIHLSGTRNQHNYQCMRRMEHLYVH